MVSQAAIYKEFFMRRFTFALLSVFLFAVSLCAQTVDEIIAKEFAARGGVAKLKAIQSLRLTADAEVGGSQVGFTQIQKRPMKLRRDISIQGLTLVQAYDGQTGWQIVPFTGKKDPEVMPADDLKMIQEEADLDGPLMDYKQKGNTIELIGKEKVEGTDAYHLKITLKNGDVRNLFLDADTFLAIKMAVKITTRGSEFELEIAIGDYKEVEGIKFPFSIEQHAVGGQGPGQKVTFNKIEINVPLDDSQFKMPAVAPAASPQKTGTAPPATPEPAKKPDTGNKPPQK
jgi:outer membrane lipoprotein-sorting protein